ncbi:hypothetical protein HPB47_021415 [Ixodes persulcatus]|uniref:Uncharacterized protein n=1 Tax=Ixodes persulcatus TaxID=34615 RepID=A0AC60QCP1_IXOPE|nr:hypothetical protein HPB47_021415 [Ixodes persulcatus]
MDSQNLLLAKLADSDNTSSSDDDDEGRVYEAKFAELFDAPCTVPKVKAYVSIVRTYSDKAVCRSEKLRSVRLGAPILSLRCGGAPGSGSSDSDNWSARKQPEPLPGSNTFAKGADLPNNNNPKVDTTGDHQNAKA